MFAKTLQWFSETHCYPQNYAIKSRIIKKSGRTFRDGNSDGYPKTVSSINNILP